MSPIVASRKEWLGKVRAPPLAERRGPIRRQILPVAAGRRIRPSPNSSG